MTLREQYEQRQRQWDEFHRWEAQQPPAPVRDPAMVLADLSAMWRWLPPDARVFDPDPEKLGIQKMRAALALLKSNRR